MGLSKMLNKLLHTCLYKISIFSVERHFIKLFVLTFTADSRIVSAMKSCKKHTQIRKQPLSRYRQLQETTVVKVSFLILLTIIFMQKIVRRLE